MTDVARETGKGRVTVDWSKTRDSEPGDLWIPGVDMDALQAKYSPNRAHEPKLHMATFRVPKDMGRSGRHFAERMKKSIGIWIEGFMKKEKWEVTKAPAPWPQVAARHNRPIISSNKYICLLEWSPEPYVLDGETDLNAEGEDEIAALAWFCMRHPQPIKIEVPFEEQEPLKAH